MSDVDDLTRAISRLRALTKDEREQCPILRSEARVILEELARLRDALEAADALVARIKAEGGHGFPVHDLADAYDAVRKAVKP